MVPSIKFNLIYFRGYNLKYFPFREFRYLSCPSFSNKNLNNKIDFKFEKELIKIFEKIILEKMTIKI